MVNTASESRHPFYRDAAALLEQRRRLFDGDREQLETLLTETAITPDDDETLLELFVLFRFIATLEELHGTNAQFETIKTGRQEIAQLTNDDGTEIAVYHDNSASKRGLSFRVRPDGDQDRLPRTEKVHTTGFDIANDYFQDRSFQTHTGRPDIIVLEITHPSGEQDYLVAEVKNSTNTKTIRQGIKETLEYLAFLQQNDEFVYDDREATGRYFGDGWNGLLVIQDLVEKTASLDEQQDNEIKILQASEVDTALEQVLQQFF